MAPCGFHRPKSWHRLLGPRPSQGPHTGTTVAADAGQPREQEPGPPLSSRVHAPPGQGQTPEGAAVHAPGAAATTPGQGRGPGQRPWLLKKARGIPRSGPRQPAGRAWPFPGWLASLRVVDGWVGPSDKHCWPPPDPHLAGGDQAPLGLTEVQESAPQRAASQQEVVSCERAESARPPAAATPSPPASPPQLSPMRQSPSWARVRATFTWLGSTTKPRNRFSQLFVGRWSRSLSGQERTVLTST